MLRPQIGVVTTIGGDHYKAYRSLAAVAEEKSKLVRNLPRRGVAILNADDPHVRAMSACTRARVITYGHSPGTDFRAIEVSSRWPDRLSLTIVFGSRSLRIKTKLVGEHWTTSVLAAFACALTCGLDADCCVEAIAGFEPLFARSSVHSIPNGPKYILDTDKAPYWTFEHTFAVLQKALAPRTTIVIGTISDYPGAASPRYRKVARAALQAADRVIFVGPHSGHITKLSKGELAGRLLSFQTSYQVAKFLNETAIAGELIYIKSSVRDHLERIMLTQVESVVCWKERCRKFYVRCPECGAYRTPSSPPQ
jgi:UDP-N-acetylmuramoyl-tripeptide--D-alanyl-D-alanine ligase